MRIARKKKLVRQSFLFLVAFFAFSMHASLCLATVGYAVIRDSEAENLLKMLAASVFNAAGLSGRDVRIVLLNDPDPNAFVIDNSHVFFTTGMILSLHRPEHFMAVAAHETAHIVAAHLPKREQVIRNAAGGVVLTTIAGIAAVMAGAGQGGVALAAAGLQVAERKILAHSRSDEAAADIGAIGYLEAAGIDPVSMLEVHKIFLKQQALYIDKNFSYTTTHPLAKERIKYTAKRIEKSHTINTRLSAELQYRYQRVYAKIRAFTVNSPRNALLRVKIDDKAGWEEKEIIYYSKAILLHRLSRKEESHKFLELLLKKKPDDPYYHEIKGQFYLEEGNKKAAIESYIVAAERAPKDPLILAILGELFVDGKGEMLETGLALLKKADMLSLDNTRVKFTLARAYALSGDHGMAALTAAERFFLLKDEKFAALHAKRALNLLPQGNSRWLRAQDIIVRTEEAKKER